MAKKNIIRFLEEEFGEDLIKSNLQSFLKVESRPSGLVERCLNYLKNIKPSTRSSSRRISRPFVWRAMGNVGSFGGDLLPPNEKYKLTDYSGYPAAPEVSFYQENNLKSLLMFHHQVVTTDYLAYLFSIAQLGQAKYLVGFWKESYEAYLRFLISVRPLIDKDILCVTSDRRAHELAPVNTNLLKKWEDIDFHNHLFSIDEKGGFMHMEYPKVLAYLDLVDEYDSDEFFFCRDKDLKFRTYTEILRYSGSESENDWFAAWAKLKDAGATLSIDDVVKIRLNEDCFEYWREGFSNALEATTQEEFKERIKDAEYQLIKNNQGKWIDGIATNFLAGVAGGIVGLPFGLEGVLIGAVVGTAASVDLQKRGANQTALAAFRHYSAVL